MNETPLSGEVYVLSPDLSHSVLVFVCVEVIPNAVGGWMLPPLEMTRGEMMERFLMAYREGKHTQRDEPSEDGIQIITCLPPQWNRSAVIDSLDEVCEAINSGTLVLR